MTASDDCDMDVLLKQRFFIVRRKLLRSLKSLSMSFATRRFEGTLPATIIGHDTVEIRRNDLYISLKQTS